MALKKVAALCVVSMLPALGGCVVVGYTSGGGWFVWPPLGLFLVVLVVVLLLRRR